MDKKSEEAKCPSDKCDACCKEIPESVALTVEGSDYVRHFCGTDCYEEWKRQQKEKQK